jgi:L-ribulose-5-phosphate 4-epimerase
MGHFSARLPGTEEIIIKPRDVPWNKVTTDDLATFNLNYQKISGPDQEIIELPIHIEMYREKADVEAVVHTHQKYATLIGSLGLKIELLDPNTLAFSNGIPLYDENDDSGYFSKCNTLLRYPEQGRIAAKKIGNSNVIILKAHGPIIVGRSVEEACMLTIALENSAEAQLIATMIRGQKEPIENLKIPARIPSMQLWKSLLASY